MNGYPRFGWVDILRFQQVEKSLVPILDEEAIRVLKSMPKWTPAKKNGKVVKSHATVPFTFKVE